MYKKFFKKAPEWIAYVTNYLSSLFELNARLTSSDDADYQLPKWIDTITILDEFDRINNRNATAQQIKRLQECLTEQDNAVHAVQTYKRLLTDTGKTLEKIVIKVLSELGFTILETETNRSDVTAKYGDINIVIEIKGVNKSASEKHSAQLEKWAATFFETNGHTPKPILIVNAYRNIPLQERIDPVFVPQMIEYAESRKHALIVCEMSKAERVSAEILSKCFNENYDEGLLIRDSTKTSLEISVVPDKLERKKIYEYELIPADINQARAYNPNSKEVRFKRYSIELPQDTTYFATYIPSKDMLTHAKGFLPMANKYRQFPFDKTLIDIISKSSGWSLKNIPTLAQAILPKLENMMHGRILFEEEEFYIQKDDGRKISLKVEAEGLKKIVLLWQLLMTENITADGILIWDEPESNLNPKYLPKLAECLLELSRHGTQIFLGTHNYIFAKYFDVLRNENDFIKYHALYFDSTKSGVKCESGNYFETLQHNDISNAFNKLLECVYNLQISR